MQTFVVPPPLRFLVTTIALAAASLVAPGQTIDPEFVGAYTIRDLGAIPGVPLAYGGLTFKAGSTNTLLVGGEANSGDAKIYQVNLSRGADQHLNGFVGSSSVFAAAYGFPNGEGGYTGGIDGGLTYGPGGVLFYTSFDDNGLHQIRPGGTAPAKQIGLTPLGVDSSVGSLVFVPPGFPGAGRLKLLSFSAGQWYDTTVSSDGAGTYNIAVPTRSVLIEGGPEGAFYVAAGNPRFPRASVLVADYAYSRVDAYEIDSNGDPIVSTRRTFVSGLSGATGATRDPLTGDFVFAGFTSTNLYVVGGFSVGGPTVAITTPTNNAQYVAPAVFMVEAAASEVGGSIAQVELFLGTNSMGADTAAPYFWALSDVAAGTHTLQAIASDSVGLMATSAVVTVHVSPGVNIPPVVALTNPVSGTVYWACSNVRLVAGAQDADGYVTAVSFWNGSNALGEVTVSPYVLTLTNPAGGTYSFTARATDNGGAIRTSAVVNVTITAPPANRLVPTVNTNLEFECCFGGQPGTNYIFEGSTNLNTPIAWASLVTNSSPSGVLRFTDPASTNKQQGYYRVRRAP